MLLFFEIAGIVIGIYVLTVLALLALIRLKKDSNSNLILDSNSWHFKMAYPFRKFDSYFVRGLREDGTNICPYFAKLVFMLYIGWPGIIAGKIVCLIWSPITLILFGRWMSFNLQKWQTDGELHCPTINLPRIKGFKILPVYLLMPLVYVWLWLSYPAKTYFYSYTILIVIGILAVFYISCILVNYIRKNSESVSLLLTWMADTKKRMCHHLKVV